MLDNILIQVPADIYIVLGLSTRDICFARWDWTIHTRLPYLIFKVPFTVEDAKSGPLSFIPLISI